MSFGDVYQQRLTGEYEGQVVQYVFNWKHVVGESVATALTWNDTFVSDILPAMLAIHNELFTLNSIETINWRDPSDFHFATRSDVGGVSIDGDHPLASWLTNLFRFNRNFPGQAHGFKRFAAGVESMFFGNLPELSWDDEMDALAAALTAGLTASLDRTARYFVVDRTSDPELGANPPGYVSNTCIYRGQGTQKSRKA